MLDGNPNFGTVKNIETNLYLHLRYKNVPLKGVGNPNCQLNLIGMFYI